MANCAKCSAELIGSAKFCAACGAPVAQPPVEAGPSTIGGLSAVTAPSAPSNVNIVSVRGGFDPNAPVNPFAVTASPNQPADPFAATASPSVRPRQPSTPDATGATDETKKSPSIEGAQPSQVSPLAVSNAISQRGAFQQALGEALEKGRSSVTPPAPPVRAKKPGTQLMPSAPNRLPKPGELPAPSQPPPASPPQEAAPAKKAPPRTVAMDFGGKLPAPGAPLPVPAPNVAPPNPAIGQQLPVPRPAAPYNAPYAQPPPHAQPSPAAPGGWGWAPQQPAHYPYGFGYVPGSRVQVTWSNGQRYPATVSQVSGSQCLVVFPDGQQHWVEMQYLSPS